VIEEGVFRPLEAQTRNGVRGTASGKVHEHATVELLEATRTVTAAEGVTFGFRFRISGLPRNRCRASPCAR
jgi:hypothetical protein